MKAIWVLIGIGLVIAMMGGIMDSIHGSTTAQRIDTVGVTTNSSTASLTLQEEPWKGLTASVLLVTSNVTTDHPIVQSVAAKSISLNGLDADYASHALTVTYEYNDMNGYVGGDAIPNLSPLMIWLGIIMIVVGVGIMVFKR